MQRTPLHEQYKTNLCYYQSINFLFFIFYFSSFSFLLAIDQSVVKLSKPNQLNLLFFDELFLKRRKKKKKKKKGRTTKMHKLRDNDHFYKIYLFKSLVNAF